MDCLNLKWNYPLMHANGKSYDLIIVGAGPAGICAALEAQKYGLKTLIIEKEKMPRYKVCGGGYLIRDHICDFDLTQAIERRFNDIHIYQHGTSFHHHLRREKAIICTVMRDRFDQFLFDRIDGSKVEKRIGLELTNIKQAKTEYRIEASGNTFRSKYVIAADGANSRLAKICGWKEDRDLALAVECELPLLKDSPLYHSLRFDIGFVPKGYAWVFPKKNHLSIGLGKFSAKKISLNLHAYLHEYLRFLDIKQVDKTHISSAVIPISPRKQGLYKENVLLCGDAAGLADPLVAEGISFAMMSGKMAVRSIVQSIDCHERPGVLYQQEIKKEILHSRKFARFLAHILYDKPGATNYLIKKKGSLIAEKFTDSYLGGTPYPDNWTSLLRSFLKLFHFK